MINFPPHKSDDFMTAPIFETEKALNRVHNKKDLLERVIDIFVKSLMERKDVIERELNNENWETLATMAHSIKGSSWTIGAQRLGNIAYKMEKAADQKDLAFFRQLFEIFKTCVQQFIEFDKKL
jgi:HPt (histidine-containing phosphotransfer) domain-containing protein